MILNCGAGFVQWRPSSHSMNKIACLASPEQLRQQLDCLHKEANNTRAKANNARSRLVRLSEAAEKFKRQAAANVQTGKEDDARKVLLQKRKIMQAMEKLKSRIELFDELSAKLNEAISMKEGLLIGNIGLDVEVNEVTVPTSVRFVSPKEGNPKKSDEYEPFESQTLVESELEGTVSTENEFKKATPKEGNPNESEEYQPSDLDLLKLGDDQGSQILIESEGNTYGENESKQTAPPFLPRVRNDLHNDQHRREISSYEEFMKHIDQQFRQIEEQLETFLSVSALLLESRETQENLKARHITDVLDGIRDIRERLASINKSKMEMNQVLDEA